MFAECTNQLICFQHALYYYSVQNFPDHTVNTSAVEYTRHRQSTNAGSRALVEVVSIAMNRCNYVCERSSCEELTLFAVSSTFYELNHHGAILQARLLDGLVQHVRQILLHEDQLKLHALFAFKRASFQPLE